MKFWHVAAWHGSAGYSSPFSKTNFVNKFNSREYFFHHFFFSTNVKRTLTYQPYDDLLSALVLYTFDFLFKRRFVCVSLHMNKRHSDARYMHRYMHTHSHTKCRTSHAKICKEIKRIILY